jgi:ABC-type Fe3+-hydroxamate transport system substrate-binding protein
MIRFQKTPYENIPLTLDFVDALPTGETLDSSPTITATDVDGNDVTADLIDDVTVVSPQVTVRLLAVVDPGVYLIRYLMTTTPGAYTPEADVKLTVKEPV